MWTKPLLKSKGKALVAHLSISALLFLPIIWLISFRWYPPPFFYTDGGWQGVRIMLWVDMVLGPALTFLVFNPAKTRRALAVDFSFIGISQALALAYGAMTIEHGRLRAMVFADDAFYAVANSYFVRQGIESEQWKPLGEGHQAWVYLRKQRPEDQQRYEAALKDGLPLEAFFFLYEPLAAGLPEMEKKAVDVARLAQSNPELKEQYDEFIRDRPEGSKAVKFYRFFGAYKNIFVALDADGKFAGYLASDPLKIRH